MSENKAKKRQGESRTEEAVWEQAWREGASTSSHVKNYEFYPKGNQCAVKGFKSESGIVRFMFLKERSDFSAKNPEMVRPGGRAGGCALPGERLQVRFSFRAWA